MTDLMQDLRNRWTPSLRQSESAYAELTLRQQGAGAALDDVVTIHLLLNKRYGFWTEDVQVVELPGVFPTRNEACEALMVAAAAIKAVNPELTFTTGYTYHHLPTEHEDTRGHATGWSVFEDILAVSEDAR